MSSQAQEEDTAPIEENQSDAGSEKRPIGPLIALKNMILQEKSSLSTTGPPLRVDDTDLLLYDVFLLVNLAVSISFWVVHRLKAEYVGMAFSEGCLLALCWIAAGLWNGAFLYSAVDGNHPSTDEERAGPRGAGLLALNTFVFTANLRLSFALIVAVAEHRQVGGVGGELLLPLELGCGLLLMGGWRALHSSFTPRI